MWADSKKQLLTGKGLRVDETVGCDDLQKVSDSEDGDIWGKVVG